jgi:hypothetical protein
MAEKEKTRIHGVEVEILTSHADYFNAEMEEVLRYQAQVDPSRFDEARKESKIAPFREAGRKK